MNISHSSTPRRCRAARLLAVAPLLVGLAAGTVRAGSTSGSTGGTDGGFTRRPFTLTLDTRFGYDDNTLDETDNKHGSAFVNTDLSAAYATRDSRTSLSVGASTGYTYYFDRPGRNYDPNVGLNVALSYKLTPRATISLTNSSVYQSEPDFGVVGLQERRNGDYFFTSNGFTLAYRFAPRFSTTTSYNPSFFVYREEPYSFYQDRAEHIFAQSLRFLVQPRLTLVAEYRFGYEQYFNSRDASISIRTLNNGTQAPVFIPDYHSDSYTHFVLAGVDYALGPRFRLGLRAGAEFRTYADEDTFQAVGGIAAYNPGDRITTGTVLGPASRIVKSSRGTEASPYVEATLGYDINRRGSLSLVTRYGIEEGDLAVSNSSRDSFRIGVTYNQAITARLGGYLGFNYTNSSYNNADGGNDFSDNVYDVSLGLRYVLNRHVALEAGYTHTTVSSEFSTRNTVTAVGGGVLNTNNSNEREYDRNRYFIGARFAF